MRRIIVVFVAALLLGAVASEAQLPTQGTQWNYTRDVMVFAGNDSFYVGRGTATGTDSTTFELRFASSAHTVEKTNWLDISQLWVPPFLESYCDTAWTTKTKGLTRYGTAVTQMFEAYDSLAVPYASNTTWHSWPIAMRIGASVSSGATTTDSISISVQASMDKVGYKVVWQDFIEPSYISATSAKLLADATTTKRIMSIPAGKLYGWKYMRLAVKGDGDHKSGLACKLYHYYRMYATPDVYKRNVTMEAR